MKRKKPKAVWMTVDQDGHIRSSLLHSNSAALAICKDDMQVWGWKRWPVKFIPVWKEKK